MKKTIAKITATLSAAILCAVPMSASASSTQKIGDINNDGVINAVDAALISQHYGTTNATVLGFADVNGNDAVNAEDKALILQYAVQSGAGTLIMGDADEDGSVDILDVITINKWVSNHQSVSHINLMKADVNADGVVDSNDSLMIMQYIVGLIDSLG